MSGQMPYICQVILNICPRADEEFLAATVNQAQLERKENMVKAFEFFDTDRSGFITVDELEQALQVGRAAAGLHCMPCLSRHSL